MDIRLSPSWSPCFLAEIEPPLCGAPKLPRFTFDTSPEPFAREALLPEFVLFTPFCAFNSSAPVKFLVLSVVSFAFC